MRTCVLSCPEHAEAAQLRQLNSTAVRGWRCSGSPPGRAGVDDAGLALRPRPHPLPGPAMASHVGGARFAYNWGFGLVESRLRERTRLGEQALVEGLSEREADAQARTVEVPWNLYALRREWNATKGAVAPWWPANSKEAYSSGLDGLARAL